MGWHEFHIYKIRVAEDLENEALENQDIENELTENGVLWTIITHQGDFQFFCDGYRQFIRQEPFFQFGQTLSYIERYGFSLDRTTSQDNLNRF